MLWKCCEFCDFHAFFGVCGTSQIALGHVQNVKNPYNQRKPMSMKYCESNTTNHKIINL